MLVAAAAHAQTRDYPNRPVRVIVPTSPGGILDIVTRLTTPKLAELMGQSVVVENRAGASSNIGSEFVARAAGDGYTLLVNTQPLVINPSLFAKLPFDVEKDFAAVSQLTAAPYLLVAHPSLPVKTVKELLALARARPDALNYASGGKGTNLHIAIELLKNVTGTKLTHVPYKGAGLALASVIAGETELAIPALGPALPQVNAGRLRALAISGRQRSAVVPQVPTIAESGVPGYEFSAWVGVLAPASTPPALIGTLNGFFVKALRSPELSARLAADGNNVIAGSPAEFAALIKSDIGRWAKVVRENGIKPE